MRILLNNEITPILWMAQAFLGTLVVALAVIGLLWMTTKINNLGRFNRA